jgi:transposase
MIRSGFLSAEDRRDLIALTRDGLAAHRLARRANALLLLDDGLSCAEIAKVLFIDDDTVRTWHRLFMETGFDGLGCFDFGGSAGFLSSEQESFLVTWISATLPRSTREVGAFIQREFEVPYESRSGLIALLHRLGLEYRKPEAIGRKLDVGKQTGFVTGYDDLLNHLGDNEAVLFADAVHPTHEARAAGCWVRKGEKLALDQTSGRDRLNIHGAINLETGQTCMLEAQTIDAASTIRLLEAIETMYPALIRIHVFLDNARYHHARIVQAWLARPECRIKLHFIPPYSPHLNPIERLWGLMHRNVTHNRCYPTIRDFAEEIRTFLKVTVPKNWATFRDSVSDNFRIINPANFRWYGRLLAGIAMCQSESL